jgi:hypothetical protein
VRHAACLEGSRLESGQSGRKLSRRLREIPRAGEVTKTDSELPTEYRHPEQWAVRRSNGAVRTRHMSARSRRRAASSAGTIRPEPRSKRNDHVPRSQVHSDIGRSHDLGIRLPRPAIASVRNAATEPKPTDRRRDVRCQREFPERTCHHHSGLGTSRDDRNPWCPLRRIHPTGGAAVTELKVGLLPTTCDPAPGALLDAPIDIDAVSPTCACVSIVEDPSCSIPLRLPAPLSRQQTKHHTETHDRDRTPNCPAELKVGEDA